MKLYKIKSNLKQYFITTVKDEEMTVGDWIKTGVTIETLEEVERRVVVCEMTGPYIHSGLCISGRDITTQEMQDIEEFLNVFGSMEKLYKKIKHYSDYYGEHCKADCQWKTVWFEEWIKENN